MDDTSPTTIVKRTRASGPKVRTGCLTCKSRHVKCDERKPECLRCTSTGRKCEGYLNLERRGSHSDAGSSSNRGTPSPTFGGQMSSRTVQSPKELRSIELFFLKVAPQLSGYFQEPFWRFTLQFSFDESAIRHALVAVSAEYENDCFLGVSPLAGTSSLKKLSLEYYNRAIRSMVKKLEGKDNILVPVMGCVIFVCLEFLRRDMASATKHIDGGIKMIQQWRARRAKQGKRGRALTGEAEIVERIIVPMFGFLNIQTAVFGRPSTDFYSRHGEPNRTSLTTVPLRGIEDVIISLLDLLNAVMRWVQHVAKVRYTSQLVLDDFLEQARLLKLMEHWKSKLDVLEQEQKHQWSIAMVKGLNMLKTNYTAIRMLLNVQHSPYETTWDEQKASFEEILQLSEGLMGDTNRIPDEQSRRFSFELGIIPPLNLMASRCRYPSLRRRALALLAQSQRRECLFDTKYCTALQERIMCLEEAALKLPAGTIPTDDQLPPESARIHLIHFAQAEPGQPEVTSGWEVAFFTRPYGLDGQWNIWKELIDVDKAAFNEVAEIEPAEVDPEHEEPQPDNDHIWDLWRISMASSVPTSIPLTADA